MRKPRWRAARRKTMKDAGITTTYRQRVWIVTLKKWNLLPAWLKEKVFFPRNPIPGTFWLKPADAMGLMMFCRTIRVGYSYQITEFKRCPICRRPTVGSEAMKLRAQMESSPKGRELPCGPNCLKDAESKLWDRASEVAA
jgi:hypothetical protein